MHINNRLIKRICLILVVLIVSMQGIFISYGSAGVRIHGKVTDSEGRSIPGTGIIDIYRENGSWVDHVFPDTNGEFEVAGLTTGKYKLQATPGNESSYAQSGMFDIIIAYGKYSGPEIVLKLLKPQVKGIVKDLDGNPPAERSYYLSVEKPDGTQVKRDMVYGDGAIRVGSLPDGIYKIRAIPSNYALGLTVSKTVKVSVVNGIMADPDLRLTIFKKDPTAVSKTYYVDDARGDDSNDGTSPERPWRTVARVNDDVFNPGDTILFKRGGTWRERLIITSSGVQNKPITFGAYGTGKNPVFMGSLQYNKESDWHSLGKNLWATADGSVSGNTGFVMLGSESPGNVGIKCDYLDRPGTARGAVDKEKEYYSDSKRGRLILYCDKNPVLKYKNIEIAYTFDTRVEEQISGGDQSFITLENLSVKYFNINGIQFSNSQGLTIRKCNIYFGGGQYTKDTAGVRFGNGITLWDTARDDTVEDCNFWEIFDSAISNQGFGVNEQSNLYYRRNLMWNCENGFELWDKPEQSILKNIYFENNIAAYSGYGWGSKQRKKPAIGANLQLYCCTAHTNNIHITNNLIFEAIQNCLLVDPGWLYPEALVQQNNTYYQSRGIMVRYKETDYSMAQFGKYKRDTGLDAGSKTGTIESVRRLVKDELRKRDNEVNDGFLATTNLFR